MTTINHTLRDRIAAKLREKPMTANDLAAQLDVGWMGVASSLRGMHQAGLVRKRKCVAGEMNALWVAA